MIITTRRSSSFLELKVDEIECTIFDDSVNEIDRTIDNLEETIEDLKKLKEDGNRKSFNLQTG